MAKAGEAYSFRITLFDSDGAIVDSPTLAAGDVVVFKGDDSSANIGTLPTETAAGTGILNVALTAGEMAGSAGDNVTVKFEDQAGDEWESVVVDIPLTDQDVDDVAAPGDAMTLEDDAITSAKYDEATAFPLASADTGATAVARTGADGDTLEDLSDEIAVVDGVVDAILLDTGTDGVLLAAAAVDDILDEVVEGAYTMRQLLRLIASALFGEASGGGTTTITFRDLGDTKDRIEATVDADGNRTAMTLDAS